MNEVEILKRMVSKNILKILNSLTKLSQDHPNILKLYEFYQDKRYFFIVTE